MVEKGKRDKSYCLISIKRVKHSRIGEKTDIDDVHFEVKRRETLQLYEALAQAIEEAGDHIPVVLHRRNRKPWVAIVRHDDLPKLAVQLYLTLAETA